MVSNIPKSTKALVLKNPALQRKPVYHDAVVEERPISIALKPGEVLVRIGAAAFNHREVCTHIFTEGYDNATNLVCSCGSGRVFTPESPWGAYSVRTAQVYWTSSIRIQNLE